MKLLFLTNFYPPLSQGGYEEWCREVADGLRSRGHDVIVLTSRYHRETAVSDPEWVFRDLYLEMDLASLRNGILFFINRKKREAENLKQLNQHIVSFVPDVVLVWGMWNLPWSLPAKAEADLPGRVVYYLGDYWPTLPTQHEFYWRAPSRNWLTYLPKTLLRLPAHWMINRFHRPKLKFAHGLFCTEFLRAELERQHVEFQNTKVIYGAINTARYANGHHSELKEEMSPISLLFVGRLQNDKGAHTAIKAITRLVKHSGEKDLHLNIAGSGDPDYTEYLIELVRQNSIEPNVTFLGAQPQDEMPHYYRQADILLFPSIWQEPFGRVPVEAMAAGVVVVGTRTGGAAEVLIDNQNALTFPPDDDEALANQILKLKESSELRRRLAENGRRLALEKFNLDRMVDEIETYLMRIK